VTGTWFEDRAEGVVLRLQIQPKASRSEVVGLHGEPPRLKIRVAAPPVDGAANEELAEFLGRRLRIPKSRVLILRGESGKTKDVLCAGVTGLQAEAALLVKT
jgi:uncharacterized protein (TIGR00251 family)